jgi:hypothetical protein
MRSKRRFEAHLDACTLLRRLGALDENCTTVRAQRYVSNTPCH